MRHVRKSKKDNNGRNDCGKEEWEAGVKSMRGMCFKGIRDFQGERFKAVTGIIRKVVT